MDDTRYRRRVGATLRGILNDLKRNEVAAAGELGVDASALRDMIEGARAVPPSLVERAVAMWPVNERDFCPLHDDAPTGVLVMRAAEAEKTSRVFQRGGVDYYEYRDTAMSRVATLRPEWIRILQVVDDGDAGHPAVRWNVGHFLFQFTYFVGDVNYYYEWRGRRSCRQMSTGDSIFGPPYAPHSFASRNGQEPGLILALTYGGRLLGDPQHELAALGAELAAQYALPSEAATAGGAVLRMHVQNGAHSLHSLAGASGLSPSRLREVVDGDAPPTWAELEVLADALRVSVRDLVPVLPDTEHGIRVVRAQSAARWLLPDGGPPAYRVKALAASRSTPLTRPLELEVLPGAARAAVLESALHQYGYHLGGAPTWLRWRCGGHAYEEPLSAGDSFYVKPFVPHAFVSDPHGDGGQAPRLLLLRASGRIGGDAMAEASLLGRKGLRRLVSDAGCWYDANEPN